MTRLSRFFLPTYKEDPQEAETVSHKLMLRSGMIQSHASGIYSLLPMGHRVYSKVREVIRKHMNAAGSCEVEMPVVQPASLWKASERWQKYGPDLARFSDRHDNEFCLGPTHEEISVDIANAHIQSYRDLPFSIYQIQTKFRDEIRPRFGVMRGREFVMKDAYSFHADEKDLHREFLVMKDAYSDILDEMQLSWVSVGADSGSIGGEVSREFQVLASTGEDWVAVDSQGEAFNLEVTVSPAPQASASSDSAIAISEIHTPSCTTIEDLEALAERHDKFDMKHVLKSLVLIDKQDNYVLAIVRGCDKLNEILLNNHLNDTTRYATSQEIYDFFHCSAGSIGPVGLSNNLDKSAHSLRIVVDRWARSVNGFICGSNKDNYHSMNCEWERDVEKFQTADIRVVQDADPDQHLGHYTLTKGIEVGHIFQLGDHYSHPMGLSVSDENGERLVPLMGCYGFGVTRVIAAAIEQNHDGRGIKWPMTLAPWNIHMVQIGDDDKIVEYVDQLYMALLQTFEVVLDDRKVRPGVKFADADLVGCPIKLIVGIKGLSADSLEIEIRGSGEKIAINNVRNITNVIEQIQRVIASL